MQLLRLCSIFFEQQWDIVFLLVEKWQALLSQRCQVYDFYDYVFYGNKVVNHENWKKGKAFLHCVLCLVFFSIAYRQLGELALIRDEASLTLRSDILVHLVHGVPYLVDTGIVCHVQNLLYSYKK